MHLLIYCVHDHTFNTVSVLFFFMALACLLPSWAPGDQKSNKSSFLGSSDFGNTSVILGEGTGGI